MMWELASLSLPHKGMNTRDILNSLFKIIQEINKGIGI